MDERASKLAADDARTVAMEDDFVCNMLMLQQVGWQLCLLAKSSLAQHLSQQWELTNEALVLETLIISATKKATEEAESAEDNKGVLELLENVVIPLLKLDTYDSPPTSPDSQLSVTSTEKVVDES